MPLYDYFCDDCGQSSERVFPINDFPKAVPCHICGAWARKVIVQGHGGVQCDNKVLWLKSALRNLQPRYERSLETRGEYKAYLKDRDIRPDA